MDPETAVICPKCGFFGTGPHKRWVKNPKYYAFYVHHCKEAKKQALEMGVQIGTWHHIPKKQLWRVVKYRDYLTMLANFNKTKLVEAYR